MAVVEGDWESWTFKWKIDMTFLNRLWGFLSTNSDLLYLKFFDFANLSTVKLSDGSDPQMNPNCYGGEELQENAADHVPAHTPHGRYFAEMATSGAATGILDVYKDGVLKDSIDLTAFPLLLFAWQAGDTYYVSISPDGRYIFVDNWSQTEAALLEAQRT